MVFVEPGIVDERLSFRALQTGGVTASAGVGGAASRKLNCHGSRGKEHTQKPLFSSALPHFRPVPPICLRRLQGLGPIFPFHSFPTLLASVHRLHAFFLLSHPSPGPFLASPSAITARPSTIAFRCRRTTPPTITHPLARPRVPLPSSTPPVPRRANKVKALAAIMND